MVKSLPDLIKKFQDESACRDYLVKLRWNGKPVCPYCEHTKAYVIENGKRFKCASKECYKKFSVTVGTIFEASNIPLTTWFPAMYLIASHKKGISSLQLAKDLGITQKTAWFLIHRIREALKDKDSSLLSGIVEVDETYMGRKYRSDYLGLPPEEVEYKVTAGRNYGAVLGISDRATGNIKVKKFDSRHGAPIKAEIKAKVQAGSMLHTDEAFMYRSGLDEFGHKAVFHSKRIWVKDGVHTNNVENFWSVMKRGVYGIYHQISFKHLQRYCDEFSYRYNTRKIKDNERFELVLSRIEGRLTYKQLTGDGQQENNE